MKKVFYSGLLMAFVLMTAGASFAAEKGLYTLVERGINHVDKLYRDSTIRITADTTDEELAELSKYFTGGRVVEEEPEETDEEE